MIEVVKRDGEVAEFSLNKITEAIKKAFKATKKDYNNEILELLSLRVTADFQGKMRQGRISVEEIQDSVEHVLEQTGYTDVAVSYTHLAIPWGSPLPSISGCLLHLASTV